MLRIAEAFRSIYHQHNTTLSQVNTSGLKSRTHPAAS
jgi:hypothetical protein